MIPLRILLVDDHDVMRGGLRSLLESRQGWEVCGEAVNSADAVEKARALQNVHEEWHRENLVEPMGFEPTTSSMPSRRAPNCATAPPKERNGSAHSITFQRFRGNFGRKGDC